MTGAVRSSMAVALAVALFSGTALADSALPAPPPERTWVTYEPVPAEWAKDYPAGTRVEMTHHAGITIQRNTLKQKIGLGLATLVFGGGGAWMGADLIAAIAAHGIAAGAVGIAGVFTGGLMILGLAAAAYGVYIGANTLLPLLRGYDKVPWEWGSGRFVDASGNNAQRLGSTTVSPPAGGSRSGPGSPVGVTR